MLSSVCFERCIRSCSHHYGSDTEEFQFSKVMVLIYTPTYSIQNGFYCFISSPAFATIHLLHFSHSGKYILDFHCDFNWNFSLAVRQDTFSSAYQHLDIFFCEIPFEIFAHLHCLLICNCFYSLLTSLSLEKCNANILSHFVAFLFTHHGIL